MDLKVRIVLLNEILSQKSKLRGKTRERESTKLYMERGGGVGGGEWIGRELARHSLRRPQLLNPLPQELIFSQQPFKYKLKIWFVHCKCQLATLVINNHFDELQELFGF